MKSRPILEPVLGLGRRRRIVCTKSRNSVHSLWPRLRPAVRTAVVRTAKPASGPPAKLPRWCSPRAWGYPFALRGGPQTSLSSFSAGDGAATVGATSTCGACARFQATRQRAPQNLASFRVAWASAPHCWHLNSNQYQRCRIAPMLALLTLNP